MFSSYHLDFQIVEVPQKKKHKKRLNKNKENTMEIQLNILMVRCRYGNKLNKFQPSYIAFIILFAYDSNITYYTTISFINMDLIT